MRRPAGVVVSCIVLGFVACILLLTTVIFIFLSTMMGHIPLPAAPGQPAPDPAILRGVMIGVGLICLIPTAWATATVVGLARMKNWARYSVIVIGSCLVLFGLLGIMGAILSHTLMANTIPPGQSPAMIRFGMIFNVFFELVVMGIGVWWIVYFTQRSTREAFALAASPPLPPASIYPPSPYAASTYEVASYVAAPVPEVPSALYATQPQYLPALPVDAPPARPLAITIIGWLYLVAAICSLPAMLLPLPMFFLGVTISGWPAHITALCFAAISALVGFGLLRLEKIALYTAFAFCALGFVNTALMLFPSYRDRMIAYQQTLIQKMLMGMPMPPGYDNHTMALMMVPGIILGIAFTVALLALLVYNRAAFDRPATPHPAP